MIIFLRSIFCGIFISMGLVTVWASHLCALWQVPKEVITHPWFVATLFDTYFAFLTFWAWVAYKETSMVTRVLWLIGILLLGNFVISAYLLLQLFRLPVTASMRDLLLQREGA